MHLVSLKCLRELQECFQVLPASEALKYFKYISDQGLFSIIHLILSSLEWCSLSIQLSVMGVIIV